MQFKFTFLLVAFQVQGLVMASAYGPPGSEPPSIPCDRGPLDCIGSGLEGTPVSLIFQVPVFIPLIFKFSEFTDLLSNTSK